MFSRRDRSGILMALLISLAVGCGKASKTEIAFLPPVSTDFFSSGIQTPTQYPFAPGADALRTSSGYSLFYSDGVFEDFLDLSDGGIDDAFGSYAIQPDGRMHIEASDGILRGAVNPVEDFLYQLKGNGSGIEQELILSASPFGFPAGSVPDFTGHYTMLGLEFRYTGAPSEGLRGMARSRIGVLSIVHSALLDGSFFFQGSDSAGDPVLFQGSFLLDANDLTLHFFLDGIPGEVWTGSFAPSGLLLLADRTPDNGDTGHYAALLRANFQGPGPLAFEGAYSVAKLRLFSDSSTAFGSSVERTLRQYGANGVFAESCDLPFSCSGSWSNVPYTLNVDGTLAQEDPALAAVTDGAISEDLGCFLAVEMGASAGSLPQEIALVVGVRLL